MSATGTVRCPKCGSESREGAGFCRACGTALAGVAAAPPAPEGSPVEASGPRFRWGWAGIATVMILALQTASGVALMPLLAWLLGDAGRPPEPQQVIAALAWVGGAIYFLCALVVGRLSRGRPIHEAALAAFASCAVNLVAGVLQGMDAGGPLGALLSCAGFTGLGAFGAWLGTKLQARAQAKERPRY